MIMIQLTCIDGERIAIPTDAIGYVLDFEGTAQIFITHGERGTVNLRETYEQVLGKINEAEGGGILDFSDLEPDKPEPSVNE